MKKFTLFFATVFGLATMASAQIRIAPEVGASFSKIVTDPSTPGSSYVIGPRVGGLVDIALTDNLYLQPGVAWAMKGVKSEFLGLESTISTNYIEVPINVMYKLGKEGSGRFFFGLGPNIGYAISGKMKSKGSFAGISFDDESDITFGSDSTDMKALDFGGNINIGYELPMGLYARAYYQMGFANLANAGVTQKNTSFGLAIGYLFGGKN